MQTTKDFIPSLFEQVEWLTNLSSWTFDNGNCREYCLRSLGLNHKSHNCVKKFLFLKSFIKSFFNQGFVFQF